MIRDQTEILLKSIGQLAEQNVQLADYVVNQNLIENYNQILDDIHGVNSALKIKSEHINLYRDTCVTAWTDIATEVDMQDVNLQFGRIGSFMQRFCANKKNMDFCGQLLYQYVLMATQRDMTRTAAFAIAYRSNFDNHEVKYGALVNEFKKAQEMDKAIFEPIVASPSLKVGNQTNPYCQIACALRSKKNDLRTDLDAESYGPETLGLAEQEKKTVIKFMDNVSFLKMNTQVHIMSNHQVSFRIP